MPNHLMGIQEIITDLHQNYVTLSYHELREFCDSYAGLLQRNRQDNQKMSVLNCDLAQFKQIWAIENQDPNIYRSGELKERRTPKNLHDVFHTVESFITPTEDRYYGYTSNLRVPISLETFTKWARSCDMTNSCPLICNESVVNRNCIKSDVEIDG